MFKLSFIRTVFIFCFSIMSSVFYLMVCLILEMCTESKISKFKWLKKIYIMFSINLNKIKKGFTTIIRIVTLIISFIIRNLLVIYCELCLICNYVVWFKSQYIEFSLFYFLFYIYQNINVYLCNIRSIVKCCGIFKWNDDLK